MVAGDRAMQRTRLEGLGRVALDVVHEMNNLLTAASGSAELAKEGLPSENPAQEYLQISLDASMRAAGLARQILAYANQRASIWNMITVTRTVVPMIASTSPMKRAVLCRATRC